MRAGVVEVPSMLRLLAIALAVAAAWLAIACAGRFSAALRTGTFQADLLKDREHRINHGITLFQYAVFAMLLALAAVEFAFYGVVGAPLGTIDLRL